MQHRMELNEELAPAFKKRETAEWLELLKDAGVPAGPVLNVADMLKHPQTLAREMVVENDWVSSQI